jgi:hypothetical protein
LIQIQVTYAILILRTKAYIFGIFDKNVFFCEIWLVFVTEQLLVTGNLHPGDQRVFDIDDECTSVFVLRVWDQALADFVKLTRCDHQLVQLQVHLLELHVLDLASHHSVLLQHFEVYVVVHLEAPNFVSSHLRSL